MANNSSVIKKLRDVLKTDLSDVLKAEDIFIGARKNLLNYPALFIIPRSEDEAVNTMPHENISLDVVVEGVNRALESDNCFISDDTEHIGILDFNTAVKKVLDLRRTLENTVINISLGKTEYVYDNNNIFFSMIITIEYRTIAGMRT